MRLQPDCSVDISSLLLVDLVLFIMLSYFLQTMGTHKYIFYVLAGIYHLHGFGISYLAY